MQDACATRGRPVECWTLLLVIGLEQAPALPQHQAWARCCNFMLYGASLDCFHSLTLKAVHRCVGHEGSPALRVKAALNAGKQWTEPLVPLAAVTGQCIPAPGERGSCSRAMETLVSQMHTPEREPRTGDTKMHPCRSLGPQKGRYEWCQGCLGMDLDFSIFWGTRRFLRFAEENALKQESHQLPQLGHLVNKNIFPPPLIFVLLLCMVAGSQIPFCPLTVRQKQC